VQSPGVDIILENIEGAGGGGGGGNGDGDAELSTGAGQMKDSYHFTIHSSDLAFNTHFV
jgi:hypothetical protein